MSEYKRDTTAANRALTTTYTYDALNRLTSAHEEGIGVNTTRTYEYDTLGNMIREEQDGCVEYRYNGYSLDESTKCGTIPNSIGTAYWEYTYDGRGNLISNDKYTRTTSGMDWQNVETYVYDETNRMVQGTNENGEVSIYTYNGLGIRVGRELIVKDNTHGYTDFHSQTPSVETGLDKPEVVKESYVVDYTSATFNTLVMDEVGGFNYRWTYGLDKLNVKITSEGTNWWGQHVTTDILKDYLHQDRMGSTTNLTDTFGRVVGRADYNEWGEMTYREALSITSSYRRIYPQSNYTGHDWDDVLSMYYAKARFYSADDKRFVAMDPVKGSITDPLSLVSYLYCVDNPLRYVDPLGKKYVYTSDGNDIIESKEIDGRTYVNLDSLVDFYPEIVPTGDGNGHMMRIKVTAGGFETSVSFRTGNGKTHPVVRYTGDSVLGGVNAAAQYIQRIILNYNIDEHGKVYVDAEYFNNFICATLGANRRFVVKDEENEENNEIFDLQTFVTTERLQKAGWRNATDELTENLIKSLEYYEIYDPNSIKLFIASMLSETEGKDTLELPLDREKFNQRIKDSIGTDHEIKYTVDERGAGYLQLTWRSNHIKFLESLPDESFRGKDTATFIAKNYPMESAAWYWKEKPRADNAGPLNEYVEMYGSDDMLGLFLATQYYINGWRTGINDDLAYVRQTNDFTEGFNSKGKRTIIIRGNVWTAPSNWDTRKEFYYKVMEAFK